MIFQITKYIRPFPLTFILCVVYFLFFKINSHVFIHCEEALQHWILLYSLFEESSLLKVLEVLSRINCLGNVFFCLVYAAFSWSEIP